MTCCRSARSCFVSRCAWLFFFVQTPLRISAYAEEYDYGASDDACLDADLRMNSDPVVLSSRAALESVFPEVHVPTEDPVEINIYHNYGSGSAVLWQRMQQSCVDAGDDNALCTVETKTSFVAAGTQSTNGQSSLTFITEKDKPVCFSSDCVDEDVRVLEPNPARCGVGLDCEVLSYDVTCPDGRRVDANTNRRCRPPLASDSPFFRQRGFVEASILANCATAIAGTIDNSNNNNNNGARRLCEIETGTLPVFTSRNFSDYRTSEEFFAHEESCRSVGGEICRVDMVAANLVDNHLGVVGLYKTYVGLPTCVPVDCRSDVRPLVTRRFAEELSLPNPCDVRNNTCVVEVTDVRCDGGAPSATPSVSATPTSSSSPTGRPTRRRPTPTPTTTVFITRAPTSPPTDGPATTTTVGPRPTNDETSADVADAVDEPNGGLDNGDDEGKNVADAVSDVTRSYRLDAVVFAVTCLVGFCRVLL